MTNRTAILLALVVVLAVLDASALEGQAMSFRPRIALAVGGVAYRLGTDTVQTGEVVRLSFNLESASSALGAELEGAYHHIDSRRMLLGSFPGCFNPCNPYTSVPAFDLWVGRVRGLWHLRGAPGGVYVGVGLGAFVSGPRPGNASATSWGYDVGVGLRPAGRGLFVEARFVRVPNRPLASSLIPFTIGFLF